VFCRGGTGAGYFAGVGELPGAPVGYAVDAGLLGRCRCVPDFVQNEAALIGGGGVPVLSAVACIGLAMLLRRAPPPSAMTPARRQGRR
jgi:hypothetical protein